MSHQQWSQQPPPPPDPPRVLRLFSEDAPAEEPQPASDGPLQLSASMSLCEFAEAFVLAIWLKERNASLETIELYRDSLNHWKRFTKDPPLSQLDLSIEHSGADYFVGIFVAGLYAEPGRKSEKASPATVHRHCRTIQTCLTLAGPRSAGSRSSALRKAQRLIGEVPWIEKPTVEGGNNEASFTLEELGAILDATDKMPRPLWPGLTPGQWWRSLVILAYNTGERRRALLEVKYSNREGPVLHFPRGIRKGKKRSHAIALNSAAIEAIESIWTEGRDVILPWKNWPKSRRWFHTNWHRLLNLAGIPEARQFGLHGIRKCAGTEAATINPLAAQLLLGHSDFRTTQKHYLHPRIQSEALAKLPQPKRKSAMPAMKPFDPKSMLFDPEEYLRTDPPS